MFQAPAPIRRALISVSDKSGIIEFARFLQHNEIEILSTGGTARLLRDNQISVVDVGDYTGVAEMLDGRVKTLHPRVHGGILAMRNRPEHLQQLDTQDIGLIDLVVVNLYPFEQAIRSGCNWDEAIENIDIGGPTMLRSAAKNHQDVSVVVDPQDYERLQDEIEARGTTSLELRRDLARKVFLHTARYDSMISEYLNRELGQRFPESWQLSGTLLQSLRYGENPHQQAAFYQDNFTAEPSIALAEQLHGKELSYNNIVDADAALELVKEFSEPSVAIIKHTNPCGAASAPELCDAYVNALKTDPTSAFGGVIAVNVPLDARTAEEMARLFLEIIVAPEFSPEALEILQRKKNLRLLQTGSLNAPRDPQPYVKKVTGGFLVQDRDLGMIEDIRLLQVPTQRKPHEDELQAMAFAWKVCKHVKSNAIVFAFENQLAAVGAGQMSRVDSSRIAVEKAQMDLNGSVMASDAFFPFRDGIDAAAAAGVRAIIQPGGSVRDEEVIAACDEHQIALVLTGMRHFRH